MPINRSCLHENKFEEFKTFLVSQGWELHKPTNCYEVVRAKKKGEKTIVLYKRSGTSHATVGLNMEHANKLIWQFIKNFRKTPTKKKGV